jgi:hypothetical protein
VRTGSTVRIGQALGSGEQVAVDAGIGQLPQEQLAALRFRIDGARAAE